MTTIGFVTIGQAPRTDVTPAILEAFPEDIEHVEVGALDEFDSAAAVEAAVGPVEGKPLFVTRLADGSSVSVDRAAVIDLVRKRISEIEDKVGAIGMLCTGNFPSFEAAVPVLEPSELLHAWVHGIAPGAHVGVIMPEPEQLDQTIEKWGDDFEVTTAAGSPYGNADEVSAAAHEIGTETDVIVMDCIGYDADMKRTVQEITDTGVLLGRSVLAKTASELLCP